MVNVVVLVGRLGNDPKVNVTTGGVSLCRLRLAVSRRFRNQKGERETDWIDVVAWRDRAEYCGNYLKKGSLVAVEGRLQVRSWETPEGEPRRVVEVVAENIQNLSPVQRADSPPPDDMDAPPSAGPQLPTAPGVAREALAQRFPESEYDDSFAPPNDDESTEDIDLFGQE